MVQRKWPCTLSVLCLAGIVLYQASFTDERTALAAPSAMKRQSDRSKVTAPGKVQPPCEEEVVQAVGVSLFVFLAMPQYGLEKAVGSDVAFLLIVAPVVVHFVWQLFKFWRSLVRQVMQRPSAWLIGPTLPAPKQTFLLTQPELEASAHSGRYPSAGLA
mmetsp:Transcript_13193/g.30044  ORF Transcript_13193/g.30044 Transcript_13193/m.30044 type:complete len:159 (+) Transcript_13193:69-545(+)